MFSNSNLVTHTRISPNYNVRNQSITKITIHHMAGNCSVEVLGEIWSKTSRQASSNYGINGKNVGLYVEEKNRAWTSGSPWNDYQAVTIEVANCNGDPNWEVTDESLNTLILLCADICQRNKIPKLEFTGDKNGSLTLHNMFKPTGCPGAYLTSKMQYICDEVNKKLGIVVEKTIYRVQLGAFSDKDLAESYKNKVISSGFENAFVLFTDGFYKVQVGAFEERTNAENFLTIIEGYGFNGFVIAKEV